MANNTEDDVLEGAGFDVEREDHAKKQPVYRVFKEARIPVSKAHGKMWKQRREDASKQRSQVTGSWDECLRYFNNDQFGKETVSRTTPNVKGLRKQSENVVYSN